MHSDGMGQGRSRSPCPYKYRPSAEDRGGEKKEKKSREKREDGGKGGDRERETDWVERETTETEKHKKTGEYRLGN
jgi:hypothetical protein